MRGMEGWRLGRGVTDCARAATDRCLGNAARRVGSTARAARRERRRVRLGRRVNDRGPRDVTRDVTRDVNGDVTGDVTGHTAGRVRGGPAARLTFRVPRLNRLEIFLGLGLLSGGKLSHVSVWPFSPASGADELGLIPDAE